MKSAVIAVLGSAVLATVAVSGASAQIVTNGGFETGDFSGWTTFGDFSPGFVGVDIFEPHSGSFAAFFGPVGDTDGITQLLGTTAGDSYTFSFWLENESGEQTTSADVDWNGVSVLSLSNGPAFGYTLESFTEMATSTSTPITFTFQNDQLFWDLDDVSVVDNGPAGVVGAVTPEPATMTLMATGLVAMAGIGRRRKRAK